MIESTFRHIAICLLAMRIVSTCGLCRADGPSKWVYPDSSGKLVYRTLRGGNRIIDFSYAGYRGGGVAIPEVPVKITVHPGGNDSHNNAVTPASLYLGQLRDRIWDQAIKNIGY
jgi:hypothetical protein